MIMSKRERESEIKRELETKIERMRDEECETD